MGDEGTRSQGEGPGSSSGEGTFISLKQTFKHVLDSYSTELQGYIFKQEHIQKWEELSSSLDPAKSVKDRARALAFILQSCTTLLLIRRKGQGCDQEKILKNVRFILWHACMDDHSDYTLLQRRCFQYYGECVIALEIFYQDTVSLLSAAPDAEVHWKDLRRLIHEAGSCMLQCWSMIRRQDSSVPRLSPALREDYLSLLANARADPALRENYQSRASPGVDPDMERFFDVSMDAHGMLTEHICWLATDLLTGMKKNSKLEVNKEETQSLLDGCEKLMEGTVSRGILVDQVRGVLNVVRGRYESANLGADNPGNLNAFLKGGPANLPTEMSSIAAAAWMDLESQRFFDDKPLFDFRISSQLDHSHFRDAASCLIFSTAPGIYALYWLLYWIEYLGLDAEAAGGGKTAAFLKKLHSRLQEGSGPERPVDDADKQLPVPQTKSAKKRAKQKAKAKEKEASQTQGAGS